MPNFGDLFEIVSLPKFGSDCESSGGKVGDILIWQQSNFDSKGGHYKFLPPEQYTALAKKFPYANHAKAFYLPTECVRPYRPYIEVPAELARAFVDQCGRGTPYAMSSLSMLVKLFKAKLAPPVPADELAAIALLKERGYNVNIDNKKDV